MEQPAAIVCGCRLKFSFVSCDVHVWWNDNDNSLVDESINDRALPGTDAGTDAATENGGARNGNATCRNGTHESVSSPGCRYGNGRNAESDDANEPGFDDGPPSLNGDGSQSHGHDAASQHASRTYGNATGSVYTIQHYAHAATPDEDSHGTCGASSRTAGNGWRDAPPYESTHDSFSPPRCGNALSADGTESDDAQAFHDEWGLPPTTKQHDGPATWCSTSSPRWWHHAHSWPASDPNGGTTNTSAGTACATDVIASAAAIHAKPTSSTTAKDSANER